MALSNNVLRVPLAYPTQFYPSLHLHQCIVCEEQRCQIIQGYIEKQSCWQNSWTLQETSSFDMLNYLYGEWEEKRRWRQRQKHREMETGKSYSVVSNAQANFWKSVDRHISIGWRKDVQELCNYFGTIDICFLVQSKMSGSISLCVYWVRNWSQDVVSLA